MESVPKKSEDEYVIKNITPVYLTDEALTPNILPRITQPTFGKYLVRTDGEVEKCGTLHPEVLSRRVDKERAHLILAPEKTDLVFKLSKNFTTHNYHPRNNFSQSIFPRPYTCEYEYIEAERLKNLDLIEERYKESNEDRTQKSYAGKKICGFDPPFCWKSTSVSDDKITNQNTHHDSDEECEEIRWKPTPDLFGTMSDLEIKTQMAEVGLPFKHEALKFYAEHFPKPKSQNKYLRLH